MDISKPFLDGEIFYVYEDVYKELIADSDLLEALEFFGIKETEIYKKAVDYLKENYKSPNSQIKPSSGP